MTTIARPPRSSGSVPPATQQGTPPQGTVTTKPSSAHVTPLTRPADIVKSVGASNGINQPDDVRSSATMLRGAGLIDEKTYVLVMRHGDVSLIQLAITDFQKAKMQQGKMSFASGKPDGRIDPNGKTWKQLVIDFTANVENVNAERRAQAKTAAKPFKAPSIALTGRVAVDSFDPATKSEPETTRLDPKRTVFDYTRDKRTEFNLRTVFREFAAADNAFHVLEEQVGGGWQDMTGEGNNLGTGIQGVGEILGGAFRMVASAFSYHAGLLGNVTTRGALILREESKKMMENKNNQPMLVVAGALLFGVSLLMQGIGWVCEAAAFVWDGAMGFVGEYLIEGPFQQVGKMAGGYSDNESKYLSTQREKQEAAELEARRASRRMSREAQEQAGQASHEASKNIQASHDERVADEREKDGMIRDTNLQIENKERALARMEARSDLSPGEQRYLDGLRVEIGELKTTKNLLVAEQALANK